MQVPMKGNWMHEFSGTGILQDGVFLSPFPGSTQERDTSVLFFSRILLETHCAAAAFSSGIPPKYIQ